MPPRVFRLEAGQLFASTYRVVRTLGKGSMGIVYLVEDTSDGQPRALKLLSAEVMRDARALERHERETSLSAAVTSERVVKTVAAGVADGQPWLAMEYVEGQHLDEFLATGPSLAQRRAVLTQLFEGVAAVHAAGYVHRDLKPDNVLVREQDGQIEVKILDFGVAKRLGISPNNSTAEGLGTPLWTAPEQATSGRGLSPAADIWALGLLTFFVLTGRLYWRHANTEHPVLMDLIVEMTRGELPPGSQRASELGVGASLSARLDPWFARCLVRDPAGRFDSAAAAHRCLVELLDEHPHRPRAPRTLAGAAWAPDPALGSRLGLVLGLVAAVLLAAAAVLGLRPR